MRISNISLQFKLVFFVRNVLYVMKYLIYIEFTATIVYL